MSENVGALLGYVGQIAESGVYAAAMLVVTLEGDPVDFAYTEPVILTPLQRTLFGKRADSYLAAKVLAPALLDKAQAKPTVLCFDETSLLERSAALPAPIAVFGPRSLPVKASDWTWLGFEGDDDGVWLQRGEAPRIGPMLAQARTAMAPIAVTQPFRQLREALATVRREATARPA